MYNDNVTTNNNRNDMKEQEIIENNRMIAEFIGMEIASVDELEGDVWVLTSLHTNGAIEEITNACFHFSWDWLMPVVEKIEKDHEPISIIIYKEATEVKVWGEGYFIYKKVFPDAVSKIGHVYIAVIEFIKWYNSQPRA